jgi:hypothetical protein
MPDTFIKIASVTVGSGGASSIDFTSIPSTYTDLVLKLSGRSTANDNWANISFNGSTASFSSRGLFGDGSSSGSYSRSDNVNTIANNTSSATANTFSNGEIYIPNYAGSNNKSYSVDSVTENNGTSALTSLVAGLRSNTAAITSITLTPNSGNFAQYTTATLYGIKNS